MQLENENAKLKEQLAQIKSLTAATKTSSVPTTPTKQQEIMTKSSATSVSAPVNRNRDQTDGADLNTLGMLQADLERLNAER